MRNKFKVNNRSIVLVSLLLILNIFATYVVIAGPILESKGKGAIFQKKGKEMLKKGKIFDDLGKNVQNLKIF